MNRLEDNKDIGGTLGKCQRILCIFEKMLVVIRGKNLTFYFGVIGDAKNIKGQQRHQAMSRTCWRTFNNIGEMPKM
jgi:hypothetical protein